MDSKYTMVRVEKEIHKQLKAYAANKGMTMQNALEQLIERCVKDEDKDR